MIQRIVRRLRRLRPAGPEKVFGIGFPKTGTKTLAECFHELGFKHRSFDMHLAVQVRRNELANVLAEAAKYESFEDWPWHLIYRELDERFPNSKFILTLRKDTDAYIRSLKNHHDRYRVGKPDFIKPDWWDGVFDFQPHQWDYDQAARRYETHNRAVLEYFKDRPNDLLVVCWETGDGWDPLCAFLNKPTPRKAFPHRNSS
jgi:hypothetical protein